MTKDLVEEVLEPSPEPSEPVAKAPVMKKVKGLLSYQGTSQGGLLKGDEIDLPEGEANYAIQQGWCEEA